MVRVTPFLPLISTAALLGAPTATAGASAAAAHRQESYAALRHPAALVAASAGLRTRELLTCEQTYGADWVQCGDASSTFCYNPNEGQTCCAQDAGYCDAGAWCAPVPGFCCLDGEDVATCAVEAGFELPTTAVASVTPFGSVTLSSTATTTRSASITLVSSTTTSTTLSSSGSSSGTAAAVVPTSFTTAGGGGLTWTSVYPATVTGFGNGTRTNSTASSATPSSTYVQISVAQKEQWTLVWMTVAMGVVGVFMATC